MHRIEIRRQAVVIPLALSLACFSGCAVIMPNGGGVMPGMLFNQTTVPGDLTDDVIYAAYPDSFTVIGMVEGTSGATNILGLFSFGDAGYIAAIEDAKAGVGADGIINCTGDIKGNSFLSIFASSKTIVRGHAIKRK